MFAMDLVELVDRLCDELSRADLATLALCNRRFNQIATRRLYQHIPALSSCYTLAVLSLFDKLPQRAALVQSLVIQINSSYLHAFFRLAQRALANMTALRSLDVTALGYSSSSWPEVLTQRCKLPFQLTKFDTNFKLNDELALFLGGQPNIVNLRVALSMWPEREDQSTLDFWPPARRILFALTPPEYNERTLRSLLNTRNWESISLGVQGSNVRPHFLSIPIPCDSLRQLLVHRLTPWDTDSLGDCLDHISQSAINLENLTLIYLNANDSWERVR
jgi:hypothetical protein